LQNEKASRILWVQIENMQSSRLIEEKRDRIKRKSTAEDFQSDSDSFADLFTVGSEESSTDIQYPPIESEESSSVLENLENKNRLATTYK
ncbi:9018_t:CDS:2, partial [Paraglomus occultum]